MIIYLISAPVGDSCLKTFVEETLSFCVEEFEELEQGRKAVSAAALYELHVCELYPVQQRTASSVRLRQYSQVDKT